MAFLRNAIGGIAGLVEGINRLSLVGKSGTSYPLVISDGDGCHSKLYTPYLGYTRLKCYTNAFETNLRLYTIEWVE